MNKFETIAVAAIVGLAEVVAIGLFLASFSIWFLILTGGL